MKWKEINWLYVGGAITAVYTAGVVYVLGWQQIRTFLTTTDQLNAIGDFLAGVFAPVAVIWLVAAVLTQRQELTETRDQFGESQKVVDAQLKTINSQNSLLALQHEQSVENAAKAYKLNLFDKRFQIYIDLLRVQDRITHNDVVQQTATELWHIARRSSFVFNDVVERYIYDVGRDADEYFVLNTKVRMNLPRSTDDEPIQAPDTATVDRLSYLTGKIMQSIGPDALGKVMGSFLRVSDEFHRGDRE